MYITTYFLISYNFLIYQNKENLKYMYLSHNDKESTKIYFSTLIPQR